MAISVDREGAEFRVEDAEGQRHTVRMVRTKKGLLGPDWIFIVGLTELTPTEEDPAVFLDADGARYVRIPQARDEA